MANVAKVLMLAIRNPLLTYQVLRGFLSIVQELRGKNEKQ